MKIDSNSKAFDLYAKIFVIAGGTIASYINVAQDISNIEASQQIGFYLGNTLCYSGIGFGIYILVRGKLATENKKNISKIIRGVIGAVLFFGFMLLPKIYNDLNREEENKILEDFKNIEFSTDVEDLENYGISYEGDEPQTEFMKEYLQLYEKFMEKTKEIIAKHETSLTKIGNFVLEETKEYKNIKKLGSYRENTVLTKEATVSYFQDLYEILDEYNADLKPLFLKNNFNYEGYINETKECSGQYAGNLDEVIEITEEYYDSYVSSLDFVIQNNDTIILNGEFINFIDQGMYDQYLVIVNELVEKEEAYFAMLDQIVNKSEECLIKSKQAFEDL